MSVEMKFAAEEAFIKQMKRREDMFKYGVPLKVTVLKLLGYKLAPIVDLSMTYVKTYEDGTTKVERISVAHAFRRADHTHAIKSI